MYSETANLAKRRVRRITGAAWPKVEEVAQTIAFLASPDYRVARGRDGGTRIDNAALSCVGPPNTISVPTSNPSAHAAVRIRLRE